MDITYSRWRVASSTRLSCSIGSAVACCRVYRSPWGWRLRRDSAGCHGSSRQAGNLEYRPGLAVHGRQALTGILADNGIAISMDGKGAWRTKSFVERLWRSVKLEEVYLRAYDSASDARASIGRYLDFYNQRRPHSSLDDTGPRLLQPRPLCQSRRAARASAARGDRDRHRGQDLRLLRRSRIGEDVSERLDVIPAQLKGDGDASAQIHLCRRHRRAPERLIENGIPSEALVHVLVAKYADHKPLYARRKSTPAKTLVDARRLWLEAKLATVFGKSTIAEAVRWTDAPASSTTAASRSTSTSSSARSVRRPREPPLRRIGRRRRALGRHRLLDRDLQGEQFRSASLSARRARSPATR